MTLKEYIKNIPLTKKKHLKEFLNFYGLKNCEIKSDELKVFDIYYNLKENTIAGDVSGVTPTIGTSPTYPTKFLDKKPVYKVDSKTISYFKKPSSKKDKKGWENFLKCVHENVDLKMEILKLKREKNDFYITDGKTKVEFKYNIKESRNYYEGEELLDLKKRIEAQMSRVVDGHLKIEGLIKFNDLVYIEMDEVDVFKLYYFFHDFLDGVNVYNKISSEFSFYFNYLLIEEMIEWHIDKKFKKLGL